MKGWCGASRALESTYVRVLSPTLRLTLGTSATGCSGGKQETATSNALSSRVERLCWFCYFKPHKCGRQSHTGNTSQVPICSQEKL